MLKDYIRIYLLKRKELLLLHLHHAHWDVVAAKLLPELGPGESLTVLNPVGLPPVKSCPLQLPCCVQDTLPLIALCDVQLALHCTEPVIRLEWVRRVRERRRVPLRNSACLSRVCGGGGGGG